MANEIGIIWSSDQRQLIADLQKQIVELGKVRAAVNQVGAAGRRVATDELELGRQKRAAMSSLHRQKIDAARAEQQAIRAQAQAVRDSLLTERQLATRTFQERRQHLIQLRNEQAITGREFSAAMQKARDQMNAASAVDIKRPWMDAIPVIGRIVSVVGLAAAGARVFRSELENLKDVQRGAAESTRSYAEAEHEAIGNLDPSMTQAQLNKTVMDIAKEKHMSPTVVMNAASHALGAKGDVSSKQAVESLRSTIDLNRFSREGLAYGTTALLQAKSANPDATDEALLGQQISAKIASPVVSNENFSRFVVPGASGAHAFHDSPRDFYALSGHMAGRMGDTEGRMSATSVIDMEADLSSVPALEAVKTGERGQTYSRLEAIAHDKKFSGVKDALLQKHREAIEADRAMNGGKLTTESRARGHFVSLLEGNEQDWAALRAKFDEVLQPDAKAEALYRAKKQSIMDSPTQRTAIAGQGVAAEKEIAQLENQNAARSHISRQTIEEVLKAQGISNTEQMLKGWQFEIGTGGGQQVPVEYMQEQFGRYAQSERAPHRENGSWGPDAWMKQAFESMGLASPRMREANDEEKANAERAERMIKLLEVIAGGSNGAPNINVNLPDAGKVVPGQPATALNAPQ